MTPEQRRFMVQRVLPILERLDQLLDGLIELAVVAVFAWCWLVLLYLALSP